MLVGRTASLRANVLGYQGQGNRKWVFEVFEVFEKFTARARRAVVQAQEEARKRTRASEPSTCC